MKWQETDAHASIDFRRLWNISRYWLRQEFPAHQIIKLAKKTDRARTLSGQFLRMFFCCGGKRYLLIAADENSGDAISSVISQALLCFSVATEKALREMDQ